MKRFVLSVGLLSLTFACRRAPEPDGAYDAYGCRYPERYGSYDPLGPDPDALREYEACSKFGRFREGCVEIGAMMVGSACQRVRDGKVEYTGPSPLLGDYGFSENWWIDCKPHAVPYVEPGDPIACLTVEAEDDPAKLPWDCVSQPPEWCPPAP